MNFNTTTNEKGTNVNSNLSSKIRSSKRSVRGLFLLSVSGLALIGVLVAASGSAAPLYGGPFPNHFTMSTTKLVTFASPSAGSVVTCKFKKGEGEFTAPTTGTFATELTGCELESLPCEALAGGTPKFEGGIEVVQIKSGLIGAVFSMKELTFKCESGAKKRTIGERGSIVGALVPGETETTAFTVTFAGSGGYNKYHECELGNACGKDIRIEENRDESFWEPARLETFLVLNTESATTLEVRRAFVGTFPNSFSLSAEAEVKFNNSKAGEAAVACKTVTGSGTISTPVAGSFEAELGGCHTGIFSTCEAPGGGAPRLEGSLEVVQFSGGGAGIVFVPKEMSFHCKVGAAERNLKYRGKLLAPISPENTSATKFTVTLTAEEGHQSHRECAIGALCGSLIQLEGSVEGGSFFPGWMEGKVNVTTKTTTKIA